MFGVVVHDTFLKCFSFKNLLKYLFYFYINSSKLFKKYKKLLI